MCPDHLDTTTECSFKERCIAEGRVVVECNYKKCKRWVHIHCWETFGGASAHPRCAEHARPDPTGKTATREQTKPLMHLPDVWAERWLSAGPRTETANHARYTLKNIQADTAEELKYFPRSPAAQLEADEMHE